MLVAMLLAFLMFPGSAQLTEELLYFAAEEFHPPCARELAQADDGDAHKSCHEDACSGGFHACQCHSSVVFLNADFGVLVPAWSQAPPSFGRRAQVLRPREVIDSIQRPPRS